MEKIDDKNTGFINRIQESLSHILDFTLPLILKKKPRNKKENQMDIKENLDLPSDEKTPQVSPGTYSPVIVQNYDSLGALFLGIFALILLVGWMRSEERNRRST